MSQSKKDFNLTFKSEYGDRVLKILEDFCGYTRRQISLDTNTVMFNEGKRAVFVEILRRMNEQPIKKGEGVDVDEILFVD